MRSTIIQRQVRNIINYGHSQEGRRDDRSLSQRGRPQSAKINAKVNRTTNDLEKYFYNTNTQQNSSSKYHQSGVYGAAGNASFQADSPQASKVVGRQLVFEKEKLYQEQFQLKRSVHNLNDQNLKYRTRIQQLEGSVLRYEKIIEEVDSTNKPQFFEQVNLTNRLKREVKALRLQVDLRQVELQKLKRDGKHTKVVELEIERKALSDETMRLKYLLEQTIQSSILYMSDNNVSQDVQDKLLQQTQLIQQGRLERLEKDQVIARLQKQCLHYKTSQIEVESKLMRELKKSRLEVAEREKENDQLRSQYKSSKPNEQAIKLLLRENEELKAQLLDRTKQLEEVTQLKKLTPRVMESLRTSEKLLPIPNTIIKMNESSLSSLELPPTKFTEIAPLVAAARRKSVQCVVRRVRHIQFDEVRWVGETLRYRLVALKIDWRQIDDYLFSKQSLEDGQSSLGEVRTHLQKFPFDLDFQHSNIVGRYLVESDNDNPLNDGTMQSNAIVKSVLKKLVGHYTLDDQLHTHMRIKLQEHLSKFKVGILDAIKSHRTPTITKQQFEDCLLILGLELTPPELDYIIVQGILESACINTLNYQEMLKFIPKYDPNAYQSEQSLSPTLPNKSTIKVVDHQKHDNNQIHNNVDVQHSLHNNAQMPQDEEQQNNQDQMLQDDQHDNDEGQDSDQNHDENHVHDQEYDLDEQVITPHYLEKKQSSVESANNNLARLDYMVSIQSVSFRNVQPKEIEIHTIEDNMHHHDTPEYHDNTNRLMQEDREMQINNQGYSSEEKLNTSQQYEECDAQDDDELFEILDDDTDK